MKSFIGVILLSYVFLLIYSKHIVGSYDYEQHDTNNETAYKAANFCLEYYNKQNNESYILTKVEFAINETFAPNSYINLYFNGKKTNSNKEVEFQAIYQPRKNREPKCNIVLIDTSGYITLPPQNSTGIIGTIKLATTTKKTTRRTTRRTTKKTTKKPKGKGKKNSKS